MTDKTQATLPGIPETKELRTPQQEDVWQHRSGNKYRVVHIANLPNDERYPQTVVYVNMANLSVWARRLDDWHRSFTFVENPLPRLHGIGSLEEPKVDD